MKLEPVWPFFIESSTFEIVLPTFCWVFSWFLFTRFLSLLLEPIVSSESSLISSPKEFLLRIFFWVSFF
jgi:hypothetical protein